MTSKIRVLVVDDSAFVRKVVKEILSRSPQIEVVGIARDGLEALEKVEELNPDVVTLDLIMPKLDGVGFLLEQMARRPIPVVVASIASETGEMLLHALDAGAVDFVQKPTALATDKVFEIGDDLTRKVIDAAGLPVHKLIQPFEPEESQPLTLKKGPVGIDAVVLGISTGGPHALKILIPRIPADFPVPIALVLHMPIGYTQLFARQLDQLSLVKVKEAEEGDPFLPGTVLVAPAGRHLTFKKSPSGDISAHLDARPFDTLHRPAVDVLFHSAAEVFGNRLLAVVMTGMGSDGLEGARAIHENGGHIYTESEESCVVYGMPRSVSEAGLSHRHVHLNRMARAIMEAV
jgi:two-component system, chemotaxis family, protein-glutamate methylesterase/glutaminase